MPGPLPRDSSVCGSRAVESPWATTVNGPQGLNLVEIKLIYSGFRISIWDA